MNSLSDLVIVLHWLAANGNPHCSENLALLQPHLITLSAAGTSLIFASCAFIVTTGRMSRIMRP